MNRSRESFKDPIRLLLVGKAGSGKSSTGNTILEQNVFPVGSGFGKLSSTWKAGMKEDQHAYAIQVVDTPGFFDTEINENETAFNIVSAMHSLNPGPHAVLFVIKVGRFSNEDVGAHKLLKALFDSEISKHLLVIFTGGDYLDREKTSINKYLRDAPESLKEVIEECEDRYVVFNNNAEFKRSQIEELLRQIKSLMEKRRWKPFLTPYQHPIISSSVDDVTKVLITRRLHSFKESELKNEERQHQKETLEQ